jgi:hypothetical protein
MRRDRGLELSHFAGREIIRHVLIRSRAKMHVTLTQSAGASRALSFSCNAPKEKNNIVMSFAGKRKAKVIKIADEEDAGGNAPAAGGDNATSDGKYSQTLNMRLLLMRSRLTLAIIESTKPLFGAKTGRKPFRQSGLRKSFNPADSESLGDAPAANDDEDDGPVVVRPAISRSGSLKGKKKPKSSRLSFGGDDSTAGDDEPTEVFTPKKLPLGRALENSAIKRGLGTKGLPMRSIGDEDDRPKYSKEYLEELQSSTPHTPQRPST